MRALFAAPAGMWDEWAPHLCAACPEMDLRRDGDPASFDALLYAPGFPETGGPMDFRPFTRARLVQSLWAGVERIVGNDTLIQPLCRMVDPGLARGMVEYCTGWALRAHLRMDDYAQDGVWRNGTVPPLASERGITVLGMGELGAEVARTLAALGFRVTGWSASGRALANGRAEGFTKLLFDEETHRIVGGSIVGTNAGDLIGEIALAIEMGADATDIGRTIHPHPTLGETIGLAAEVAEGTCTDLMPPRRR